MKNQALGLLALVLTVCCLFGCSNPIRVAVSPDGKTVAVAEDRALIFHDLAHAKSNWKVRIKNPNDPKYSPNGKWVLVTEDQHNTKLINTSTRTASTFKQDNSGYAWRPDSGEFVVCRPDNVARVIDPVTREIRHKYRLPFAPTQATWLGQSEDIAFAAGSQIAFLIGGKVSLHSIKGEVRCLAFDRMHSRIVWVEAAPVTESDSGSISIMAINRSLDHEETLVAKAKCDKFFGVDEDNAFSYFAALSPDESKVLLLGLVLSGPPDLLKEYQELGKGAEDKKSAIDKARIKQLEGLIKAQVEAVVLNLGNPSAKPQIIHSTQPVPLSRYKDPKSLDGLTFDAAWMPNGKAVAIVGKGDDITVRAID